MNGKWLFLGIDPGVSGGFGVVDAVGKPVVSTKAPETERELMNFLEAVAAMSLDENGNTQIKAVLERVWSSPQMGVKSAFTFGRTYGALRVALMAADIPFEEITPGVWQQAMGVRQKTGKTELGTSKPKDKNITKRKAQDLFPSVTVTHAIADALLIAEFCRRREQGEHRV